METRLRKLRMTAPLRRLTTETRLSPAQLIQPFFVCEGNSIVKPVLSMPGVSNYSIDELVRAVAPLAETNLGGVILFGIPDHKDSTGSSGISDDGIVQRGVRALKQHFPQLLVITDVCLCEYTDHGHCGVLQGDRIQNDATVELLTQMAISHARAGADMVAPSDMMDLRISAIRRALDSEGYPELPIMAYSVKYASAFYGPFREAAQSTPAFGDRRSHQMNPANVREALLEAAADAAEGADILMVKPAVPYLDVIARLRDAHNCPIAAYQVSGEYSMIKAAAANGWIDEDRAVAESLLGIRRAGADIIISYYAADVALGKKVIV